MRDEISQYDGILFEGERLIVPVSLQEVMKEKVHSAHLGIEKTKGRAKGVLFWPRMAAEIEEMVNQCSICQEARYKQQAEPLHTHEIPERPWSKVELSCSSGMVSNICLWWITIPIS